MEWFVNDVLKASTSDNTFLGDAKFLLITQGAFSGAGRGAPTFVDWALVRKSISPEPIGSSCDDHRLPPTLQSRRQASVTGHPLRAGFDDCLPLAVRNDHRGSSSGHGDALVRLGQHGSGNVEHDPRPMVTEFDVARRVCAYGVPF